MFVYINLTKNWAMENELFMKIPLKHTEQAYHRNGASYLPDILRAQEWPLYSLDLYQMGYTGSSTDRIVFCKPLHMWFSFWTISSGRWPKILEDELWPFAELIFKRFHFYVKTTCYHIGILYFFSVSHNFKLYLLENWFSFL